VTGRLPARTLIGALVRLASSVGDSATVVRRGDETAGQIMLVARRRDGSTRAFARTLQPGGLYAWSVAVEAGQDESGRLAEYLDRQARYDPDLWVVELDTDNPERFVADELI